MRIITLIVIVSSPLLAQDPNIPAGWRSPVQSEYDAPWRAQFDTHLFSAAADIDGDEILDYALLAISNDSNEYCLIVTRSSVQNNGYEIIERGPAGDLLFLCLEAIPPGEFATACGKGYWDCADDEQPEIVLDLPAFNFFINEGTSSYLYWDSKENKMQRVWISD